MDGIRSHFEIMAQPLFVRIYRRIIIPGILRWCRILSIHRISTWILHDPKKWGVTQNDWDHGPIFDSGHGEFADFRKFRIFGLQLFVLEPGRIFSDWTHKRETHIAVATSWPFWQDQGHALPCQAHRTGRERGLQVPAVFTTLKNGVITQN